jgi:HSP20 family protein
MEFTNQHIQKMIMNLIPQNTRNGHWLADFDRMFDRFFHTPSACRGAGVEVEETDKSWLLRLDLPGFRKDEVTLSLENGELRLRAATEDEERPFRTGVDRTWTLGDDVDPEAIDARLENGVLEITLPKRDSATPATKTIEVR